MTKLCVMIARMLCARVCVCVHGERE